MEYNLLEKTEMWITGIELDNVNLSDVARVVAGTLNLDPDEVVQMAGGPLAVVDCFGILDDERIKRYFELGCEVKGLGRGHINRIKDRVRKAKQASA